MATPPTLVGTPVDTTFAINPSGATKTTAAFDVLNGDLLVARAMSEDSASATLTISDNTSGALTWTLRQSDLTASHGTVYIWTAPVTADRTGVTVTMTESGVGHAFGVRVSTWRNHGGVGVSGKASAGAASPSVTLALSANSAVDAEVVDWSASPATATWATNAGTATAERAEVATGRATFYLGRHADSGTAGSKAIGMTGAGTTTTIAAIEILGTTGGAAAGVSGRGARGVRNRKGPMSGPRWMRPRNVYLNLNIGGGFVDSALLSMTGDFADATTAFGTVDLNPGTSALNLSGDWTGSGVVDIAGVAAALSGDFAWLGQGVLDYLLTGQSLSASLDVTGSGVVDENAPAAALSGDFNATGAGTVDAFLAAVSMSGDFNWTGIGVLDAILAAQSLTASFDVTGAGTLIDQLTAASLSADFNWSGAGVVDINAPAANLAADFNLSGAGGTLDGFLAAVTMSGDFNLSGAGSSLVITDGPFFNIEVLADLPSVYYRTGEPSGTNAKDQTNTHADGTYTGGVTLGVAGAIKGDSDTAVSLNGTTGYIALPSTVPSFAGSAITFSCFYKSSDNSKDGHQLYGGYQNSGSFPGWGILFNHDFGNGLGRIAYYSSLNQAAPNFGWVESAVCITDLNWHWIVVTVSSGGLVSFYVDNQLVGTATSFPPAAWAGVKAIGATSDGVSNFAKGSIDEVAIYPAVISGSRLTTQYVASFGALFPAAFNWSGIGVVDMLPPTALFAGQDFVWTGIGDLGAFVDSANLTFTSSFDWTGIGSVNAFLAAAAFAASLDVSGAGSVLADGGPASLASSFGASGAGTVLAAAPASALDGFFNLQGAGFLIYDLIPASLASDFAWTGIGDVFSAGVLIPGRVQRGWIRHSHPTIDRIHGKVARR